MRAFSGCPHCSYLERRSEGEAAGRECPECGFPLRNLDHLGEPMLNHDRSEARRFRTRISQAMVENARRARLTLR